MTTRSTQIEVAAICAIAARALDTKATNPRTRRIARRDPEHLHEAPWPSVPDRLVAALIADDGALARAQTPTVSVIIPSPNEAHSLRWVLGNLPAWVHEVVLVDGLSTDATEVLARRIRPDAVVVHQHRRGKGAALRAGFAAATGDVIVMIDADGSMDPREMHRFVAALNDGSDFVKGSRHMEGGRSADFTFLRWAANRSFALMANILYGSRFTELGYGYCAFWRKHLDVLALTADGFEIEAQLVLGAVKAGLEIRETHIFEPRRRGGASNLSARDGARVLRTMLGQGDVRRDPATIGFTRRKMRLPIWPKPHIDERPRTVGSVVAYRATSNSRC